MESVSRACEVRLLPPGAGSCLHLGRLRAACAGAASGGGCRRGAQARRADAAALTPPRLVRPCSHTPFAL
eukprot:4716001-Pleurochrysis_carterae.AAC.3